MLILEIMEVCPHAGNCDYDKPEGACFGARRDRLSKFTCEYADRTTVFSDGIVRNPLDQTGKMKVLMEGK